TTAKAVRDAGTASHFDPVGMAHEKAQVAGIEQRVLQRPLSAALQPPLPSAFIPFRNGDFDRLAPRNAVEDVVDAIEFPVALLKITRVMVGAYVGNVPAKASEEFFRWIGRHELRFGIRLFHPFDEPSKLIEIFWIVAADLIAYLPVLYPVW